jgi:IS5 family transposase
MLGKLPAEAQQSVFTPPLELMLNPNHEMVGLAKRLDWGDLERRFSGLYAESGRPSVPIRVMVSLVLLQRLKNVSDEEVVKQWVQNPYWQFFSGMTTFQWTIPCDPTELGKFRKRIGPEGAEQILAWSVGEHRQQNTVQASVVVIDTTVQEKNVMTPRDHKLYRRVIERLWSISGHEGILLRRSYRRTVRKQIMKLRTANFPKAKKQARKAERRLKTIAGCLLREVARKLGKDRMDRYSDLIEVMDVILAQGRGGPEHIYSLHEPEVRCIGKGKDHKQYEFGTKVSLAIDPHSGVIVGAMNHAKNIYDGHATAEISEQIEAMTGTKPTTIIGDQGYRDTVGNAQLVQDGIEVVTPADLRRAPKGTAVWRRLRRLIRKRALIEPVIGHLKSGFRLCRNFLHGWEGDELNVLLAAAGWNLRKLLRFLSAYAQSIADITAALPIMMAVAPGRRSSDGHVAA